VAPPDLPPADPGLRLIKPAVRAQSAYTLDAPEAPRKLNQNESPWDVPESVKRAVLERLASRPWQRYPDFVPAGLLQRLADHAGWLPEGIAVGNGSNELIQASLTVALDAGDRVVAPTPTFALYQLLTNVLGGQFVPSPLGEDFGFDVERLIDTARAQSAKVVVVNSPNNPTGRAVPAGTVERLLEETGALIVCDEAYQEFGGPTAKPLLSRSSRLIVLRTFSKAMGMAGLRFGYALAHPAVIREITKAKLPYNVNVLTLTAAQAALEAPQEVARRTQEVIAQRERLQEGLRRVPGLTVFPSQANFVLVRCPPRSAKTVFERLHREFGILVRDVSAGSGLTDCLRITVGTAEDVDATVVAMDRIVGRGSG
jgi:histidinol-phosphate aminotransferase